jgi:hypothetical protein
MLCLYCISRTFGQLTAERRNILHVFRKLFLIKSVKLISQLKLLWQSNNKSGPRSSIQPRWLRWPNGRGSGGSSSATGGWGGLAASGEVCKGNLTALPPVWRPPSLYPPPPSSISAVYINRYPTSVLVQPLLGYPEVSLLSLVSKWLIECLCVQSER